METISFLNKSKQAPELLPGSERWTSRIRVESRDGRTRYVVTFSNGHSTATLWGAFTAASQANADVQAEAIAAATNWMAHVRPERQMKRLHYIRSQTNPNNRQRREHRTGRRAA
jgi:hypothetical protein